MSDLSEAAERILMHHFHENEPSPLLQPEEDDDIRDDCIAVAEAYSALAKSHAALRQALAGVLIYAHPDDDFTPTHWAKYRTAVDAANSALALDAKQPERNER